MVGNGNLTEREKIVLRHVVESFIKSALPVGSRNIAKQSELNLSPATIRNIMSDLEDKEYLTMPYTSAGRVPTDKGYRVYVNSLMDKEKVHQTEMDFLKSQLGEKLSQINEADIFNETSKILGKVSHLLAVVSEPLMTNGIFEKLELINISFNKILVILNFKSGIVKTIILEINMEMNRSRLEELTTFLNDRLSGLTLKQIKESFKQRVEDYEFKETELIQLFINSVDKLYYNNEQNTKIYFGGTGEIIQHPEFEDPKNFRNIIELTEDRNFVIHIFQNTNINNNEISVSIGMENADEKLKDYGIISTTYRLGEIQGKIGIIGPKRMDYSKIISLIEYTSKIISDITI